MVLIGGAGDAKAAKAQKKEDLDQVDDDDDFLSAAAAIVRTNTPASPTSRKKVKHESVLDDGRRPLDEM